MTKDEIVIKPGRHPDGMGGFFENNSEASTEAVNKVWGTIDTTHTILISKIGKSAIRRVLESNANGQAAMRLMSCADDRLAGKMEKLESRTNNFLGCEDANEDLTEETRDEIVAAVEAADVCCPEQVCDMVLSVAKVGGDWKAELAKAKANDADERKALGIPS
jgi:hypothetical protein